jgi:hypothetical protein
VILTWILPQIDIAFDIPANLAAGHVGKYATVERVVAKVFTSKSGNTFLNIGAAYLIKLLPADFAGIAGIRRVPKAPSDNRISASSNLQI